MFLLCFVQAASAQAPPGQAPQAPAGAQVPPALTPAQIEAAKKAIQSGAPLPPGAKEALEARPS